MKHKRNHYPELTKEDIEHLLAARNPSLVRRAFEALRDEQLREEVNPRGHEFLAIKRAIARFEQLRLRQSAA